MRDLLGGKGANLAEMANLGLPVPPGFTITTEVCAHFYAHSRRYPDELAGQVEAALALVGEATGRLFGEAANPLLVSVRSGARASMPGMMDTVLNLGLNDASVATLAATSGDERFAYDSYRRFIQMYSNVVLDIDHHHFEEILETLKEDKGYLLDTDLAAADWREIIVAYKAKVEEASGKPFPQDAREQLWGAIGAVFSSWMNQRAVTYRRLNDIPESWGTAVSVQAMVFGNMGETSATGVAFTRNPSTGAKELYGEFLVNAQGEDVVAGIRTPQNITEAARKAAGSDAPSLETLMPEAFARFVASLAVGLGDVHRAGDIDLPLALTPGRFPAFLITVDLTVYFAPGGMPGAGEDRVAEPADRRKRIGRAGGDADRRQLVHIRVRRAGNIVEAVVLAVVGKPRLRPGRLDDVEGLGEALAAFVIGHLIGVIGADDAAAPDAKDQPAAADLIDRCRLLGQPQRVA